MPHMHVHASGSDATMTLVGVAGFRGKPLQKLDIFIPK